MLQKRLAHGQQGTVFCLLAWLLFSNALAAQTNTAHTLRAGAATSNITPQLGGGIVGGFAPIPSTDIHDELHARCLV
ncbi:MAG: hypothetical protein ACK58J_16045, partial [Planctomyces sp.]